MIAIIKEKYAAWKERRFLKKHGCETRKQYERVYDPDYNPRATRIKDYYHGYPYVYCFENHRHQMYYWDLGYDGSIDIVDWCEENCQDKFRFDGLRVIKDYSGAWSVNEIGGGDYYFAGFKNAQDFFMFKLRWAN